MISLKIDEEAELKRVAGRTFCADIGGTRIGIFFLSENRVILIDTGRIEYPAFSSWLRNCELNVAAVIYTHLHIDHIANIDWIAKDYHPMFFASQWESRHYPNYEDLAEKNIIIDDNPENGKFRLLGEDFEIVHTPGHSDGHQMIITPDGVGFAGDAILTEDFLNNAKLPYMYHILQAIESMKKVKNKPMKFCVAAHNGIIRPEEIERICDLNINKELGLYDKLEETAKEYLKKRKHIDRAALRDKFMQNIGINSKVIRGYNYLNATTETRIGELIEMGRLDPSIFE